MSSRMYLISMILFTLLLSACSSGTSSYTITQFNPSNESPNPCVEFKMDAPGTRNQGSSLTATLRAKNICKNVVEVRLGYDIHHDLLVTDASGKVLWQWLYGRNRLLNAVKVPLEPDEQLTFEAAWSGRDNHGRIIPQGSYQLVGILHSQKVDDQDPIYSPEGQDFEAVQPLMIN